MQAQGPTDRGAYGVAGTAVPEVRIVGVEPKGSTAFGPPDTGDLLGEGAKVGDLKAFATARAVARRTACSSAAPLAESQTRTVTAGAIRRPTCWATAAGRSGSGSGSTRGT
ncbi:hypothetical protein STRTUCAR8_01955 [Streptomyces turgidiscabies Car8]|uniref:Uncharacterized protein n=1 Tax=Streptomyces turgidiscabies (strain Car8) TaxID=698760 RepID=L7F4R7_STRT8|nr:hypothetical protein STRTUCAR8_01955 [Streptomyces turgidiscabies Car8]GAQ74505.1 hypothetical protein T45_06280 [Streptomyces turgidiscabies]